MEYNLYPILEKKLKEIYGLNNENSNYLYKYVTVRASVFYNQRKVNKKQLFNFILDELNLSILFGKSGACLIYEGQEYLILPLSIEFMNNFEFRAEMEGSMNFKEELEEVFMSGYRKAQKYKKSVNYKKHLTLERLKAANREFGVSIINSEGIPGFETEFNHNPYKRTLEETLIAEIETSKNDTSTAYISEKDLEDYVAIDLEVIEEGMKLIKRQVEVPGGIVDILAKDKNGTFCVIELKIKEDKSIIWQSIHYPTQIKKMYNVDEVRMLTVTPNYSKSIYDALKSSGDVECFSYHVDIKNGKIDELTVNRKG